MNTEPPTGDDLQRMLVSMKRNVMEHADERRPARGRRRSGIVVAAVALLALGTASGAVALAVVPQHQQAAAPSASAAPRTPSPSRTPSSAPVVETPAPAPTAPSGAPAARYPTDCRALYSDADRERFFGATPLTQTPTEPDATTAPAPAPVQYAGDAWTASTWLECVWHDPRADVSNISITLGSASDDQIDHRQELLRAMGGTCRTEDIGEVCTHTRPADPYPVDSTETFWTQDGRWIDIIQVNMPTSGLLQATIDGVRASTTVGSAAGPGSWQVTGAGVGPVTIGGAVPAVLTDVERLYDQEPNGEPCLAEDISSFTRPGQGALTVMHHGGAVTALLVIRPTGNDPVTAADRDQNPRTPEGMGIGSTLTELRRTYPDLSVVGSYSTDGSTDGPFSFWSVERNGRYITFQLDESGQRADSIWVAATPKPPIELC